MKNKLIDLSWTVSSSTEVYPGDSPVVIELIKTVKNDGYQLKRLIAGMHVGTHLDAPSHFLESGKDVSMIPLEKVIGLATKITIKAVNGILMTHLIQQAYLNAPSQEAKLLIDSGYQSRVGKIDYFTSIYGFEPSILAFLQLYEIELIGVDMPSVKYGHDDFVSIHHDLLSNDIVIVENLIHLDQVDPVCTFFAMPLKLEGFDGSMIRAIAMNK